MQNIIFMLRFEHNNTLDAEKKTSSSVQSEDDNLKKV